MGSPELRLKPIREGDAKHPEDAGIEEALRNPRNLLGMQLRATRRYDIFRELFLLRVLRRSDEEEEAQAWSDTTHAGSSTLFEEMNHTRAGATRWILATVGT